MENDGEDLEVEEAGRDRWETQETPGRARRKSFGWMEGKKTRRQGGWRASAKMISIYGRVHEVLGQDRAGRAYRKSLLTCFMLLMAFLQTGHCFFTLIAVVRHTWQNTCLWRG